MKSISIKDNLLIIKIPYDINLVSLIKTSFSGRSWDSNSKVWKCPVNEKNLIATYSMIENHGFTVFPEMMIELEKYRGQFEIQKVENEKKIAASKAIDANIEIPNLKGELKPFQKAGVQFIENTNGNTLLADVMGLGKTVQSIAWSLLHTERRPILVICPETLKFFKNLSTKIIILDECHMIKNPKAQRTKSILELVKSIPYKLALSGTPSLNSRPIELYNVLKMLLPMKYGNYFEYVTKYCGATRGRYGLDVGGATNIQELSNELRATVMCRREKKDVLAELPDKTRVVVPQICDLKEYKRVEDNLVKYLIESKNKSKLQAEIINQVEQLAKIEYCKQEAVKAKLPLFTEWCKDFIEENGKLVIFAHHGEFIKQLMIELKEYNPVKIVGGMEIEAKQQSIDAFQTNKECKVIICSLKA